MNSSSVPPRRAALLSALTVALLALVTVVLWSRNRDILRDLADYSVLVAAAGKIEAGLKPYADIPTPLQTSTYLLNYGVERVFGRNYLALTWGGLIQALGGGLLLRALVVRKWGAVRATLLALAVVLAALVQHVIFFYNPVGLLGFSVVLLGLAVEPRLWPAASWRTAAILAALFLVGITKLNFLGATLALAGLISVVAWTAGRISVGAAAGNVVLVALAGLVLPLLFELVWTGVTLRQWVDAVVLAPTARHHYFSRVFDPAIYAQPVHDFHHHVPVRAIGGVGLGLVLLTGAWILRGAAGRGRPARDWLARGALAAAGSVGCGLLMVTNHETVMLTSVSYLVLAAAMYLSFSGEELPGARAMERVILAAAALWAMAGGYAAWHGSRVLYALDPPPREAYVRLQSVSPALAYFNGVRMLPAQIDAWERAAAKVRTMTDDSGRLTGVLFGPGTEWLERAYPEAILRHAPLWYSAGTTLRDRDLAHFRTLLDGRRRMLLQRGWQDWPASIGAMIAREYRPENVGSRDVLLHPQPATALPVTELAGRLTADEFRDATDSNVMVLVTPASAEMGLGPGPAGAAFGGAGPTNWSWPHGTFDAQGKAVARLEPGITVSGTVTFRAVAGDPQAGDLLWEYPVVLGPGRREVVLPVTLQPGGRPVWLQTDVAAELAGRVFAGWREMRITRTNEQDRSPPKPFGRGLQRADAGGAEADLQWFARSAGTLTPAGATLPAEQWRRTSAGGRVRVTVQLEPDPAQPGAPVWVTLAWYRGERFEIMTEKQVDPRSTPQVEIEAYAPEPGGWVGVLARGGSAHTRVQVTAWER